jgi:UDP-N-acetylmuramoyl-tripeptide--D-alanyl-D-alanine ligase
MKKIIQDAITRKAKKLLLEHKPIVVTVSGSVGKTSVRNAIATILSAKYSVRSTIKNYNNEFGVPLTILGFESPGKSILGWLKILLSKPKSVPEVFVLEYAIDHPGDMKHLCDIARPDISVLTRISPVHVEFFKDTEELAEEKAIMIERTASDGLVLLNADDPHVAGLRGLPAAKVLTYGFKDTADIMVTDYTLTTREDFSFEPGEEVSKAEFNVDTDGEKLHIELINMLGTTAAGTMAPAIAIAKYLKLTNDQILRKIPEVQFEPGRMNTLAGIKGSLIIDSSYNAAPASMVAALEALSQFHVIESSRRIAVLGHMAELGSYTQQEHRLLGMRAAELGVDLLITVGEMTMETRQAAIEAGIPEDHTQQFNTSVEAGRWLDTNIKKGDVVLIKGSQSARMEKAVKDIMAEPLRAKELIVRQSEFWMKN